VIDIQDKFEIEGVR